MLIFHPAGLSLAFMSMITFMKVIMHTDSRLNAWSSSADERRPRHSAILRSSCFCYISLSAHVAPIRISRFVFLGLVVKRLVNISSLIALSLEFKSLRLKGGRISVVFFWLYVLKFIDKIRDSLTYLAILGDITDWFEALSVDHFCNALLHEVPIWNVRLGSWVSRCLPWTTFCSLYSFFFWYGRRAF